MQLPKYKKKKRIKLKICQEPGCGRGKVQFSVEGSVHEIDAITDDALEIPTGTVVKIVEVFEGELVKVERI